MISISNIIENFLIKYKKYISYTILTIASLSLFMVLDNKWVKDSGEIAMAVIWFVLFLPILARVFNIEISKRLMIYRKELGILMWILAYSALLNTVFFMKRLNYSNRNDRFLAIELKNDISWYLIYCPYNFYHSSSNIKYLVYENYGEISEDVA